MGENGHRIIMTGDDVALLPEAAQNLGLALHKLATNAAKYGALSILGGHVSLGCWVVEGVGEEKVFSLIWQEVGGSPVIQPKRKGFSDTVMNRLATASLSGEASLDYDSDGVKWTVRIPVSKILQTGMPGKIFQCKGSETNHTPWLEILFLKSDWNHSPHLRVTPLAILPRDSGIFPMIKSLIIASLFTSTILISGASAQTRKMVCDEAQIAALERGAVAITDATKRDAAMKSASSMRDMMTKKDIAGCEVRMNSHVVDYGDVK